MQYMLFICTDQNPEPGEEAPHEIQDWVAEGKKRGIGIAGDRLRPPEDATVVRKRAGELLVTDGPFAETKEWIAGYDVIDVENLDEAIDYASRHPMAKFGRIEIRPFWPFEG
jgi:hypothetical protein